MSVCLISLSFFLYVSLLVPCLSIFPSVCSPVCLYCTPTHTHRHAHRHTHTHTHKHTSVSLDIFQLFHPTLLYLHALSLSKVTTFFFMSNPLCVDVWVCVCEAYGHSLTHTPTHTHTHRLIHGPWTLSFPISLLNSFPLISPQSPLFLSLLFPLVFLSYISPISNLL